MSRQGCLAAGCTVVTAVLPTRASRLKSFVSGPRQTGIPQRPWRVCPFPVVEGKDFGTSEKKRPLLELALKT